MTSLVTRAIALRESTHAHVSMEGHGVECCQSVQVRTGTYQGLACILFLFKSPGCDIIIN